MKVLKKAKVVEAIKRLRKMGILEEAIRNLEKDGKVYVSMTPYGILYDLTDQQKAVLQQVEEKHDALVFAVINTESVFGEKDTYLYITDHSEKWATENDDLAKGIAIAYVHNRKNERYSEVGYVCWARSPFGGILRTY